MITTADYLFAATVYVAFRSSRPEIATVLHVLEKLQDNNIDVRQFVIWSTNTCNKAVSSTGGGCSA
jgi:2-iminoacetate synthase ThiH